MSQKKAFKPTDHDAKTVLNETKSEAKHLKSYPVTKNVKKVIKRKFQETKTKNNNVNKHKGAKVAMMCNKCDYICEKAAQ